MRFDLPSELLLLSFLPRLVLSLPFQPREAFPERRYSVVAVDGSSNSAPTSSLEQQAAETTVMQTVDVTKTVTTPGTTVTPATEVLLSTVTVEETQPAATIHKTVTVGSTSVSTVSISIIGAAVPLTTSSTSASQPSTTDSASACETTTISSSTLASVSTPTIPSSSSNLTVSISTATQPPPYPMPVITPISSAQTTISTPYQPSSMQWHTIYHIWNATSPTMSYQTAASTGGMW